VRGNSELTKVNARCREVASEEWRRVVPALTHSAGLGDVDVVTLKDYCICVARIDQCEREISRNGILMQGERGMQKNGATTIVGQYRSQLARYIGELGLSPSSRGRIAPPKSEGEQDDDVFD
jgi:P27 family predicted phage terminase small subunit